MKTHHFTLKKDGNIYVIPEMPEYPAVANQFDPYDSVYFADVYTKALDRAKESAILVENQEEVRHASSLNPTVGQIYPLECGIEVKSICKSDWCDTRSKEMCWYRTCSRVPVALITFSEPKRSEEQVERQSSHETSQILNEDFKNTMREDATAYVKRQGTHDRPDITKHDYISGYCAAYSRYGQPGQPDKDHSSPAHTDNQKEPTQEELWISVDERLPKLEGRYLTYRSNGIMIVEHWHKKDSKFLWGNCYGVTHWMPIKPPITKKAP